MRHHPPTRGNPSAARATLAASAALVLMLLALPAAAGEFYVSGDLAVAGTLGESSGNVSIGGSSTVSSLETDEGDSSPVYGAALGFAFPLQHAVYWDSPRMPRWLPLDLSTPRWTIRSELEWIGGSDWEVRTSAPDVANADFVSDVRTWALLVNTWIDMPLQDPVEGLFGRQPWVRPFSFYTGLGLGLGSSEVRSSNNVDTGDSEGFDLAIQTGAGFAYQMTESVSLALGYRYVNQGTSSVDLSGGGSLDIELESHAFTTQLTWDFYWLAFPNRRASRTFFD